MSFQEYLERLKMLLHTSFPEVDLEDFAVANKVEELAWVLNNRVFNPAPDKPERVPSVESKQEGWRKA
jgi:hypothetical protein